MQIGGRVRSSRTPTVSSSPAMKRSTSAGPNWSVTRRTAGANSSGDRTIVVATLLPSRVGFTITGSGTVVVRWAAALDAVSGEITSKAGVWIPAAMASVLVVTLSIAFDDDGASEPTKRR